MNNQAAQTMPPVPQAFFDEFGVNADDRVMDYGRACYAAALSQTAGVAEGWLRACDEEMVGAHIGVANASDDYATAKKKLHDLITWHIQVATDPAVNGGFVLIPREPTPEMWKAGKSASVEAEEAYMQDRPQSVWEKFGFRKNRVRHIYDAMLAAAPAASGGEPKTDADLPGMWERADLIGGMTDAEPQPPSAASVSGVHPDALPDGTLSKSTAKRLAVASVSEDAAFEAWFSGEQGKAYDGMWSFARAAWMKRAAIEQALTQQRGEVASGGGVPFGHYWVWKDGTAQFLLGQSNWALESACKSVTPLYTNPQPSAAASGEKGVG